MDEGLMHGGYDHTASPRQPLGDGIKHVSVSSRGIGSGLAVIRNSRDRKAARATAIAVRRIQQFVDQGRRVHTRPPLQVCWRYGHIALHRGYGGSMTEPS